MKSYLLLLGADQFLRERSFAGGKAIGDFEIWTAIKNAKYQYNAYFDFCINANPLNYEEIKSEIDHYKTLGYLPKAIVPLNDWTLKVANRLNQDYGLCYLEDKVVEACRNKHIMKALFESNHVQTPKSIRFSNIQQLERLVNDFNFPVVIKPIDFGGSGGVYWAHNKKECIDAYIKSQETMDVYADAFQVSKNEFLIEEFIDSDDEVSVEVLCGHDFYEVITITEKYLSPRPWFTEMGHLVPSHRNRDSNIRQLAIQACNALGINRGVAHVEIKIKDNKLYVIEAAARPGGDAIMDLVETSYGINPYQLHISMYINNTNHLSLNFEPQKTSAIAFMKAKKGVISKINYPDLSQYTEIRRINLLKKVGNRVGDPENWSDREGLVQFNWLDLPTIKTYKHIQKANDLANKIFDCSDVENE
ncbi:ATP-grasp domain-containing protein [Staphylococcus caeli]|uniref:ATP-grasp domain-containing protein n=1 Tax=Staphylococcus caeli TaxID=2201815 RepID=UPI003F5649C3